MPAPDGTRTIADELGEIASEVEALLFRYLDDAETRIQTLRFQEYVELQTNILPPLEKLHAMCRATMRDACVLSDNGFRPASELLLRLRVVELRDERAKIALPGVQ